MTISAVKLGTVVLAAGTVTPAYPTTAAGDTVLLFHAEKPTTANVTTAPILPAGWTEIAANLDKGGFGATAGIDTGNSSIRVFRLDTRAAGTETGSTVSVQLGVGFTGPQAAQIVCISSDSDIDTIVAAYAENTVAGNISLAFSPTQSVQSGDLVFWYIGMSQDTATFVTPDITQSGVTYGTVTEAANLGSSASNDYKLAGAYAFATAGTSSGAPTGTATSSGLSRGPAVFIRLREVVASLSQNSVFVFSGLL